MKYFEDFKILIIPNPELVSPDVRRGTVGVDIPGLRYFAGYAILLFRA